MTPAGPGVLSRLRSWGPEILFLAITSAVGLWAGGRWLDPSGDPGGWWSLLERLGRGEVLYRDVFLHYGPLSPYALSLLGRLFGLSPTSFLLMNWVPAIVLGLLLLRAGRPYLTEWERFSVLFLVLGLGVFGPSRAHLILPYSPAAVHALIFSLLSLWPLRRPTPAKAGEPFLAGALAGLAFCSKQEIGLACLAALSLGAVVGRFKGSGWLARAAVGFACIAALGLTLVFCSASLDSLRHDSHFWPIGDLPGPWKFLSGIATGFLIRDWPLRLGGALFAFVYEAVLVGLLALLWARDRRIRRPLLLAFLGTLVIGGVVDGVLLGRRADPLCLSMLIAFALTFTALVDRDVLGRGFLAAVGLFAGLIAMRTAFACRMGWSSYSGVASVATALSWILFLLCCLPRILPRGERAASFARRLWSFAALTVAAFVAWDGIRSLRVGTLQAVAVDTPRGRVWVRTSQASFYGALSRWLRPGEKTLVLPESNAVEVLFGLRSASPFLYHLPGWLDDRAENELLERFRSDPPEAIVLFFRSTVEFGVEPFGRGFGKRLANWIAHNYTLVGREGAGMLLRRVRGSEGRVHAQKSVQTDVMKSTVFAGFSEDRRNCLTRV